jgi:hypothetical protein
MGRKTRFFRGRISGRASGIGFTSLLPGGVTSAAQDRLVRSVHDGSPEPVNGQECSFGLWQKVPAR